MIVARVALLALPIIAGCTFTVAAVDIVFDASGSDHPVFDMATALDAREVDAADSGSGCDPGGKDDHCSADNASLLSCRGDGSGFNTLVCAFGCGTQGGAPHCLNLEPSGAVQPSDYGSAAATPTVTSDVLFNTDDGSISGGLTRAAGSGLNNAIFYRQATQPNTSVKVGIFGFTGLTIAAGVVVLARGGSAFAIAASKQVTINGTLNLQDNCAGTMRPAAASAGGTAPVMPNGSGQGAGLGGSAMMMMMMGNLSSGGGGAGYGDVGGRGGASLLTGGAAGQLFGDLTVEPLTLVGGSGGGAGGGPGGGAGGTGGGAVQVAVDGVFRLSGTIQAGGCGGRQGAMMGSGGGGGSGGAVLLEAASIVFAAGSVVVANGGGGAGGTGDPMTAGQNGSFTAAPASGGGGGIAGGSGGGGGARGATAGVSAAASGTKPAGGGGGSVGRIAIKTLDGTYLDQGATVSPDVGDFNSAGKRATTVTRAQFQ